MPPYIKKLNKSNIYYKTFPYIENKDNIISLTRGDYSPVRFINNAEFIENLVEYYNNLPDEFICDLRYTFFVSTINDNIDKSLLKLINSAPLWSDYYYDLPDNMIHCNRFYYIKTKFNELGCYDIIDNDIESYYKRSIIFLEKDWNIIRREILLERK